MREPGDLRAGFLLLKDNDYQTLHLAQTPGRNAYTPGIHVPNDVLQTYGVLTVTFLVSKGDEYLAGQKRELGRGVIIPFDRGIRLHSREEYRRSTLNVTLVRSIMDAQVFVHLIFKREL